MCVCLLRKRENQKECDMEELRVIDITDHFRYLRPVLRDVKMLNCGNLKWQCRNLKWIILQTKLFER